jgi:hypothetical protein
MRIFMQAFFFCLWRRLFRQLREWSNNATAISEPEHNIEDNKECSGHNRAGTRSYEADRQLTETVRGFMTAQQAAA